MLTSDLYASKTDFDFELDDDDEEEVEEEKPPEPVVPVKRNQILTSDLVSRRKGKDIRRRGGAGGISVAAAAFGVSGTTSTQGGEGGRGRMAPPRRHSSIDDLKISANKVAELRGGHAAGGGGARRHSSIDGGAAGAALNVPVDTRRSGDGGGRGRAAPPRRHSSIDDLKISANKITELRRGQATPGASPGAALNVTAEPRKPERRVPLRRSRSNDMVELRLTNHSASTKRDDRRDQTGGGGGDSSSHGGGGNSVGSTSTGRSKKKTPTDLNASGSTVFSRSRRGRRTSDASGDSGGTGREEGSRRGQRSTHRMNQDRDDDGDSIVTNGSKTDKDHRNHQSSSRRVDDDDEGTVSRRGRRRGHHRKPAENGQGDDSNGVSYREGLVALKDDSASSGMDYGKRSGRSSSRLEDSGSASRRRGRRDRSQSVSRSKSPAAGDPDRAEARRRPPRRSKSAEGGSLHRMRSVSPNHEGSIPQASSRGRRGNDHNPDRRSGRSKSRNRSKMGKPTDDAPPLSGTNQTKPSSSSSRATDKKDGTSTSHQRRSDQKSSGRREKFVKKESPDYHSSEAAANQVEPNVRADTTMLLHNLLKVTSKNRNDDTTKQEKETEPDGSAGHVPMKTTADRIEKILSDDAESGTGDTTDKKSRKWSGIRSGLEFTRRLVTNKDEKAKSDSGKKKEDEEYEVAAQEGAHSIDTGTDRSSVLEDCLEPAASPVDPVDNDRPQKSKKWNIAAKLKRSKKDKNEAKAPSADQNDGQDNSRNLAPSTSNEKPKKANKWSLGVTTKKSKQEEAESEDGDMNYGLMNSLNSFSEDAIQDLCEVWGENGSEDDTKAERPELSQVGRTTSIRAVSDRRAIFESLSQPSMRFDFSDNSMKMAVPTQHSLAIMQDKIEQGTDIDEESYSSTSFDLDDPVPLKASMKKEKPSQGDKAHSVDSEEMNSSTRSTTSNPPDRRLVFSTLAEPSMKFDFSNSHLQKSSESMQVSVQSIREELNDEEQSETEEASNSKNESNRLQKSQPRNGDVASTENSSSSEADEEVQVDVFDNETGLQISPGMDDSCIQIDFAAPGGNATQAANVRAHKLNRDTSIYGFQTEGAVDLSMKQSRSETTAAINECLDETDKSNHRSIPTVDKEGQEDEDGGSKSVLTLDDSVCIRLIEQLRASQERAKSARETLRALQQEVHGKNHRYGEAQRKRELAFKALERKKIVLERKIK
mmetsp:Transcript_45571/g.110920  ORF Transcript_45571/g.110920 Transcript_45571/m.110920 type:complete len:1212 (+) Transcript_45571:1597-5232(+)